MKQTNNQDIPRLVKVHNVHLDKNYVAWINEIKDRYRNAYIDATVKVNYENMLFNWQLGRDLVVKKAEEKWGSGVVEQISLDLKAEFPNRDGFSARNLWLMKQWYLFYSQNDGLTKLKQLVSEFNWIEINSHFTQITDRLTDEQKLKQTVSEFPLVFSLIPWGHHVRIIQHSKSIEEALFYVCKTIEGGWSRNALTNFLKTDLYRTAGKAITNFTECLPANQSKLAQAITKDTYNFGFVYLDADYNEEALESALERNLTRFLLELGTGFAFVGRQKEIIVAGRTRKIDMLFYHIRLRSYIVCELKAKPFDPEFAGKLNFYVNAVDELLKTETDNPTIGLLICADKNQTEVQWAFKGISTPMGVASYENIHIKQIQEQLPTIEELQKRIQLLEE